jgi:polysaccharide lyase-like protein
MYAQTYSHTIAAVLILFSGIIRAEILVQEDFSGTAPYGFEGQYTGEGGSQWYEESVAGWSGSGSHLVVREGARQFNLGWFGNSGREWQAGDIVYVRFRIRFDDDWRWDGEGSMQNKLMEMGLGGNGASRFILHNEKPHSTTPCGLPDSVNDGTIGGFSLKKGITEECTPPVMVTFGEWYHMQIAVRASSAGGNNGFFKVWVNNNDESNPSAQRLNTSVTADLWDGFAFGGFFTDAAYYRDQGWVFDDFEIATNFDPDWASGQSAPPPQPPPPPPGPSGPSGLPVAMDFETGNFSQFNGAQFSQVPNIVSDSRVGSDFSTRANLVQGTNSDFYVNHNIGDMPGINLQKIEELYMAVDTKFSSDYEWPQNTQKIAILNLSDGISTARRYQTILAVWSDGTYGVELSDIGDWRFTALRQNTNGPAEGPANAAWDRLKVYVRLNTPGVSDGAVRMWVNGDLKLDHQNLDIRETTDYGIGRFILSSYATQSSPVDGFQWADNVVLSEVDPDGMRPAPPTAFTVD